MAKNKKRHSRTRAYRARRTSDAVNIAFGQSRNRFYDQPRRQPWRTSPNDLVKGLMNTFTATGEPVFLEAVRLLVEYGCADGARNPARHLKALGTLLATDRALCAVDEELQRQEAAGTRRSLRRAMISVIERGFVEAPTVPAAIKRLQRAYAARGAGRLPTGDTGQRVLVARLDPFDWTIRDVQWLPDDRATRQLLASQDQLRGRWVKLMGGVDGNSPGHRDLNRMAEAFLQVRQKGHREWERLLRPEQFPPTVGWSVWVDRARQEAGLPKVSLVANSITPEGQRGTYIFAFTFRFSGIGGSVVVEAESPAQAQIKFNQMRVVDLLRHSVDVHIVSGRPSISPSSQPSSLGELIELAIIRELSAAPDYQWSWQKLYGLRSGVVQ